MYKEEVCHKHIASLPWPGFTLKIDFIVVSQQIEGNAQKFPPISYPLACLVSPLSTSPSRMECLLQSMTLHQYIIIMLTPFIPGTFQDFNTCIDFTMSCIHPQNSLIGLRIFFSFSSLPHSQPLATRDPGFGFSKIPCAWNQTESNLFRLAYFTQ